MKSLFTAACLASILAAALIGAGPLRAETAFKGVKPKSDADYYGLNDPGFVYGFVSLTDPGTGKKHVHTIYAMARDREVPSDRPTWFVRFRSVSTNEAFDIRFENGAGMLPIGTPPYALSYGVRLIRDQTVDFPTEVVGRDSKIIYAVADGLIEVPRNRGVRYNPIQWRFDMVGMDAKASSAPYRALKPREAPFPDIPDAPVRKN